MCLKYPFYHGPERGGKPPLNLETLHLGARNLRNFLVFNLNARLGREFIPAQRDLLCVETSSACNLDCRFCGYGKKQSPRVRMADDLFFDCIAGNGGHCF